MYFLQSREMHLLGDYYTKYLTFRFTNPNLTAMFLASMIMFLIGAGFSEKRTFWKCLLFLLAAAEAVFLYQTFSRNSLLAIEKLGAVAYHGSAAVICFAIYGNCSKPVFYENVRIYRKRGKRPGFQKIHLEQSTFRIQIFPCYWGLLPEQQRYGSIPNA